jgi:hypothetical protein
MDVLMLSAAIAALAAALLAVSCAIMICTIVLRKPDERCSGAGPDADKAPECVVAMGPEPSDSREGSFTLPLPPGFGMSTARLF